MPKLIACFGIPGSGKTTWALEYLNSNPLTVRICADDIRKEITGSISDMSQDKFVWQQVRYRVNYALNNGHEVILDATNVKRANRNAIIKLLPAGTEVVFKVFEIDPETAKERIKQDLLNKVDRSRVPNEVVDRMYQDFLENIDEIKRDWEII